MPEPVAELTAPGTMAAPTLEVRNGLLVATWTAPEDNGGSPITGYGLQYRTGDEAWMKISSGIGTNTNYTIMELTNGSTYKVQVRAVNEIGAGDWSESATATPFVPDAPRLIAESKQLVVEWTAANNAAITGYELQYSSNGGTTWTLIKDSDITGTDHIITDLTNGSTYEVQVRAVINAQGAGEWSASATAMLPSFTTQVPAGTAASSILSNDIDTLVTTENLVVFLTTVVPGTLTVDEVSGDMTVTPATAPADVTIPLVNVTTGLITVTADTTAGTYLVYGKNGSEDVRFAEYFFVTLSPTTNAELSAAVTTGISNWGNTADLNYISTAAVTDMSSIFNSKTSFNGDISGWDVSAVTNMFQMFNNASAFNGDISAWDVGSVTITTQMFNSAATFNIDISGWDVGSLTTMPFMFNSAIAFNVDLEEWKDHWTLDGDGKYTGTIVSMFDGSGVTGDLIPSWY